jgi:hypothetical protein
MSVSEMNADNAPVRVPFYKRWTAVKPMPSPADKKFYQITCLVGGGVALLSMILLFIFFAGLHAAYTWSALALGLGSAIFYALAYLRYELPNLDILQRASDAAIYLTIFSAYTPLQLLLIRLDLYENGSIVCGWVSSRACRTLLGTVLHFVACGKEEVPYARLVLLYADGILAPFRRVCSVQRLCVCPVACDRVDDRGDPVLRGNACAFLVL